MNWRPIEEMPAKWKDDGRAVLLGNRAYGAYSIAIWRDKWVRIYDHGPTIEPTHYAADFAPIPDEVEITTYADTERVLLDVVTGAKRLEPFEASYVDAALECLERDIQHAVKQMQENPALLEEIERNTRHSGRPGERITGGKEAEKNTRGLLGRQEKEPHNQRSLDVKPSCG